MMDAKLTFGETVRRLRRQKKWSLGQLQEATGLSYSYLSRVENDSASPQAEAVTKIAEALDGDLEELLELADCLPEVILKRLMRRAETSGASLNRSAGAGASPPASPVGALVAELAVANGLSVTEANEIAGAIERLVKLPPEKRGSFIDLIRMLEPSSAAG